MGVAAITKQRVSKHEYIPKQWADRLALHGVRCAAVGDPESGTNRPQYEVAVSDVRALVVKEKAAEAWMSGAVAAPGPRERCYVPDEEPLPRTAQQAARMAVRAIYALGWKEGVVGLRIEEDRQPTVIRIRERAECGDRFVEWLRAGSIREPGSSAAASPSAGPSSVGSQSVGSQDVDSPYAGSLYTDSPYAKSQNAGSPNIGSPYTGSPNADSPYTVMIGMDPEFVLVSPEGKIVPASRFLDKRGMVICDEAVVNGKMFHLLAELRPAPHVDPLEALHNLHRALRLAERKISDKRLVWKAGGLPHELLPTGGHIHFSGVPLSGELLRVLDNYVALPLWMVEDERSLRRRPRFGFLGDFRVKKHGGFEYRTLPSWLVAPHIAAGVLALAKTAAEQHGMLRLRPLADESAQRDFYTGEKRRLGGEVERIWADLERTPLWSRYEKLLKPLRRLSLEGRPWNSDADLRKVWKLDRLQTGSTGG
mgnify:FL=1